MIRIKLWRPVFERVLEMINNEKSNRQVSVIKAVAIIGACLIVSAVLSAGIEK